MGAPVMAFCRIDDKEIRLREPVLTPDALIIQDPTLLHQVDLFNGVPKRGYILVNSTKSFDELGLGGFARGVQQYRLGTVAATELAMKHVGRAVPNVPLLGAFAAITAAITLPSLVAAIREKFPAAIAEKNVSRRDRSLRCGGQDEGNHRCLSRRKGRTRSPKRSRFAGRRSSALIRSRPRRTSSKGLGEMVKAGELSGCEFINVESEFAALSVAIGASAAGVRTYTATSSQGLLFMAEAVYNAAGLGLPIVMTIGNRAIGAPINIWNDHSDSMSMRDAGWIQLYAETNQEALDLHIQAFRSRRGAFLSCNGVHGRIHPHACL